MLYTIKKTYNHWSEYVIHNKKMKNIEKKNHIQCNLDGKRLARH